MKHIFNLLFIAAIVFLITPKTVMAQDVPATISYDEQKSFEIGGITVIGANHSDEKAIISISGLKVGDDIKVPGPKIVRAIKALWKLRLFEDVTIQKEKTAGNLIFLNIVIQERAQLSRYSYKGVKKSRHDDLNDALETILLRGTIVTENVKSNAIRKIKSFYDEKGFPDAVVQVKEVPEKKLKNKVQLIFDVDRKSRLKIQDITFVGNNNVKARKLRKKMEDTHRKRKIFSPSKFIEKNYKADKESIIAYYNTLGFRDARITNDSIWREEDGDMQIKLTISEGNRYYFNKIVFKGNSIYDTQTLEKILGIKKGDVYNTELLQTRLSFSQDGRDVSTLYMDNGYLFFQVNPIEVAVSNDSIDLELRITEGPQATIDRVVIRGNDRTHEHVIRRELRTRPGQKFSRSDIIRSQREIINLGYFNPEALGINTPVNAQRGTVDIEYDVEEKPSDQLELSAGWGGKGRGVIGTLGVSFNNFSIKNILKKESWNPLPQGDGQRLSLRAQTNGKFYQSYNASFTEPWLGGKKPTSFTVGGYYTALTNGAEPGTSSFNKLSIGNFSIGLGTRLKFPDDNFISSTTLNIQKLTLNNWNRTDFKHKGERVVNGDFYNFSINETIARSSVNDPIFPRGGSKISLSMQFTPPYSLLRKAGRNYDEESAQEKFKWLEYHKWRMNAEWYTTLVGDLVLKASAKIGMLGYYNKEIGTSPFERFQLGGDGLSNQQSGLLGYDLISLRGYELADLPVSNNGGGAVFDKFSVELRYPFTTNPNSTIYMLAFADGGNSWSSFKDFNPFDIRRSYGLGLRVFLPMFGTLGFDYGIGFDKNNVNPSDKFFDKYGKLSIVLGFEPE